MVPKRFCATSSSVTNNVLSRNALHRYLIAKKEKKGIKAAVPNQENIL
jgi:hypothetical protein